MPPPSSGLSFEFDDAALVRKMDEKASGIKKSLKAALLSAANVMRSAAMGGATAKFLQSAKGYSIKRTATKAFQGRAVLHEKGVRHEDGEGGKRSKVYYISCGHDKMFAKMSKGLATFLQSKGYKVTWPATGKRKGGKGFPLKAQPASPWVPLAAAAKDKALAAFRDTLLENSP